MEGQLKLFPLLTLTEMALRRTAVLLWSHPDVLISVSNFNFLLLNKGERWKDIVDFVKGKVLKLSLPELLVKQVSRRVTPVGLEIKEWKRIHEYYYCNDNGEQGLPGSTKLCWSTTGRINYRETAKELFRNEFDVVQHYSVACNYCLEDYVALFWEKLPENKKEYFSHEDGFHWRRLRFQWPHMLKGDYSKLDLSFNRVSFQDSAETGDKSAAGYFWKKLTHEEREASVRSVFRVLIELMYLDFPYPNRYGRGFCYLLTLMTPEQQMETVREHPYPVFLSLFLDSVWPDPFTENAALIWKYLPPSRYDVLQRKIAVKYESTGRHSPLVFVQFLAHSPPEFRKRFVSPESKSPGGISAYCFLCAFFRSEDSECAGAVFRSLDAADRVKLAFHPSVLRLFLAGIFGDRWRTVKACLRGAALSAEECERLEVELAEVIEGSYEYDNGWENLKLESFFDFFFGTGSSDEEGKRGKKRKLGNCSPEQ